MNLIVRSFLHIKQVPLSLLITYACQAKTSKLTITAFIVNFVIVTIVIIIPSEANMLSSM